MGVIAWVSRNAKCDQGSHACGYRISRVAISAETKQAKVVKEGAKVIHCECCYGDTALISGAGDAAMIQGRIRQILRQAEAAAGSYHKEKCRSAPPDFPAVFQHRRDDCRVAEE